MSKDKLTALAKESKREITRSMDNLNKRILNLVSVGYSRNKILAIFREEGGEITGTEVGQLINRAEDALLEYNKESVELVASKIYDQFWRQYRVAVEQDNPAVAASILEKIAKFRGLDKQEVTINHNLNNFDSVPSEKLLELLALNSND